MWGGKGRGRALVCKKPEWFPSSRWPDGQEDVAGQGWVVQQVRGEFWSRPEALRGDPMPVGGHLSTVMCAPARAHTGLQCREEERGA